MIRPLFVSKRFTSSGHGRAKTLVCRATSGRETSSSKDYLLIIFTCVISKCTRSATFFMSYFFPDVRIYISQDMQGFNFNKNSHSSLQLRSN